MQFNVIYFSVIITNFYFISGASLHVTSQREKEGESAVGMMFFWRKAPVVGLWLKYDSMRFKAFQRDQVGLIVTVISLWMKKGLRSLCTVGWSRSMPQTTDIYSWKAFLHEAMVEVTFHVTKRWKQKQRHMPSDMDSSACIPTKTREDPYRVDWLVLSGWRGSYTFGKSVATMFIYLPSSFEFCPLCVEVTFRMSQCSVLYCIQVL